MHDFNEELLLDRKPGRTTLLKWASWISAPFILTLK